MDFRQEIAKQVEKLPPDMQEQECEPVTGLQISHVMASGEVGMRAHDTLAMELHNVQVNPEFGPEFPIRDSKELELDQVSTRTPVAGSAVICPR